MGGLHSGRLVGLGRLRLIAFGRLGAPGLFDLRFQPELLDLFGFARIGSRGHAMIAGHFQAKGKGSHMYCPRCARPRGGSPRFCRWCGLDLEPVSAVLRALEAVELLGRPATGGPSEAALPNAAGASSAMVDLRILDPTLETAEPDEEVAAARGVFMLKLLLNALKRNVALGEVQTTRAAARGVRYSVVDTYEQAEAAGALDSLSDETRAALSSAYNRLAEFNDRSDRYERQSERDRTAGLADEHLAHLAPEVLEAIKQAADWLEAELQRRQGTG